MKQHRKAQFAIEFIILVGFVFLLFVGLMGLLASKTIDIQEDGQKAVAETLAKTVANEIELARVANDGYRREFLLPKHIKGTGYFINLIDSRELVVVYPNTSSNEYVTFLPGTISAPASNIALAKGNVPNTIVKTNSVIYVNS